MFYVHLSHFYSLSGLMFIKDTRKKLSKKDPEGWTFLPAYKCCLYLFILIHRLTKPRLTSLTEVRVNPLFVASHQKKTLSIFSLVKSDSLLCAYCTCLEQRKKQGGLSGRQCHRSFLRVD